METIITEIAGKFIKKLIETVSSGGVLAQIEPIFLREAKACAAELLSAYAESLDRAIVSDRAARRETGHRVERRGDERRLQTLVGEVSYSRTYFKKASGGYEYLTDLVLGVDKHERVSEANTKTLSRPHHQHHRPNQRQAIALKKSQPDNLHVLVIDMIKFRLTLQMPATITAIFPLAGAIWMTRTAPLTVPTPCLLLTAGA